MPYQVTEPHPSVNSTKKSTYLGAGRGGAGNISRYTTSSLTTGPSATGPASRITLPPPPTSARMMTTGRGGAGNIRKPASSSTTVTAPAPVRNLSTFSSASAATAGTTKSRTSSDPSSSSGTGATEAQRAIFSFDEELERDQRMRDNAAKTPVYHIGRGGAGNAFSAVAPGLDRRTSSAASSDASSLGSTESKQRRTVAGMMERIGRTLSRN